MKHYIITRLASYCPFNWMRIALYKLGGYKIGWGVEIARNVKILAKDVEIGSGTRIADGVFIGKLKRVDIGEYCEISLNTTIDGNDVLTVGDNCFIGMDHHINVRAKVTLEDNVAIGGAQSMIGWR